jgi:hypothetical protein
MSADLRAKSGDTPATGDQPRPADQRQPTDQPRGAGHQPAPPVTDQAAGAEARRLKYAHLTEGSGQASPRPDPPARHPGETAEAGPDRHADDQLFTALEQRMQAALAVMKAEHKAEIDALKAEHKADMDALRADYQAESDSIKAQLQQEISDLEARVEAAESWRQPAPDRSPGSDEQPAQSGVLGPEEVHGTLSASEKADAADLAAAATAAGPGGNEDLVPEEVERPDLTKESVQAVKAGLGLAGSLGFLPPGLSLAMDGDAARQAVKDMPPEDQYSAMELAHTAVTAFGSYPPEMAVAGITVCMVAPALHARVLNMLHEIRRKD